MRVGQVEIGPNDYIEVIGPEKILVKHEDGTAEVIPSQADVYARLIKDWQERVKGDT
jgi:hypothetical protein